MLQFVRDQVLSDIVQVALDRANHHPARDDLDQASDAHPIIIMHVSGHLAVANSAALAAYGVDADSPDPEGGVIGRREGSTEPNGVLEEHAAAPLLFGRLLS